MVQRNSNIYSGFFLLLVSVGMFAATSSFQALTATKIGPDFMPKIIAVLMAVVSISIIVSAFNEMRKKKELVMQAEIDEVLEPLNALEEKDYKPVIISVAMMIGYLTLMPTIGFLIATIIYLFFQMYVLCEKGNKNLVVFLVVSIISSFVIYYVFRSIFYVMLPSGILG